MSADFIDSNVILYAFDDADPIKRDIADELVSDAIEQGSGVISFQVVQEVLNGLVRKFATPANPTNARRSLEDVLLPLWTVSPSPDLYHRALDVHDRYMFGFFDSLIVAAALSSDCRRLLTEDLQHGQRIEGLTIHNPFA